MIVQPRYTEVLINLLENPETKALIDEAMSDYPLYVSTINHEYTPNIIPDRATINKKILDHYKYREIAFETVGKFIDELKITLHEIMPYYNQLMFSLDQDYDIKYNADYTRTISRNVIGSGSVSGQSSASATDSTADNSTITNTNKHINSKTPQGNLSITAENIDNVTYADEVSWNKDSNIDNTTHNGNSTSSSSASQSSNNSESEAMSETLRGNYGQVSVQSLIEKYRDLIVNIEQKIINDNEIRDLFFTVY